MKKRIDFEISQTHPTLQSAIRATPTLGDILGGLNELRQHIKECPDEYTITDRDLPPNEDITILGWDLEDIDIVLPGEYTVFILIKAAFPYNPKR